MIRDKNMHVTRKAALYGLFRERECFEHTLVDLRSLGIPPDEVSFLLPTQDESEFPLDPQAVTASDLKLGDAMDWLPGAQIIGSEDIGPVIVLGNIGAETLKEQNHHNLACVFKKSGLSESQIDELETRIKNGSALVALAADDPFWRSQYKRILQTHGAEFICTGYL